MGKRKHTKAAPAGEAAGTPDPATPAAAAAAADGPHKEATRALAMLTLEELTAQSLGHSQFFTSMLDHIPARFYIAEDEPAVEVPWNKHRVNPSKKGKASLKSAHKNSVSHANKRARLDPNAQKTISELQQEAAEAAAGDGKEPAMAKVPSLATIDELRERVANILEAKAAQRSGSGKSVTAQRRKIAKLAKQSKAAAKTSDTQQSRASGFPKGGARSADTDKDEPTADGQGMDTAEAAPAVSEVVFSKFDFSSAEQDEKAKKRKNKARPNPKQLLARAEAQQEKLDALKQDDRDKAAQLAEKQSWQKALSRATGEKVFDDPKKLKKKIKSIERKKEKSRHAWDARTKQVEKDKQERQQKRKDNLKARADARIAKKTGKKRKRPGFEGGGGHKKKKAK